MEKKKVQLPLQKEEIKNLEVGDFVLLSGRMYVARDAAHKKFIETIEKGEDLPFNIKGATIYYMGPSPKKPDTVIGSAGPTTSSRMDMYTPTLLNMGLLGMIGKGKRNDEVINSIKDNEGIYFSTIGGAGALLSKAIKGQKVLAYEELGAEALLEIEVKDFPAIVAIDYKGKSIY